MHSRVKPQKTSVVLFFILFFSVLTKSQTVETFTTSTTWTVPSGVTSITVHCWGGGGGGGGGYKIYRDGELDIFSAGGGGGGGAYSRVTLSVTPGQIYVITVGSGGTGGLPTGATAGTSTSFVRSGITYCLGVGGMQGSAVNLSEGSGGSGGNAASCIGDVKYNGGNGSRGNLWTLHGGSNIGGKGGGGAGSSSDGQNGGIGTSGGTGGTGTYSGGSGGNGVNGLIGAQNGFVPGGGGGGACAATSSFHISGGNGARGELKIVYTPSIIPPTLNAGTINDNQVVCYNAAPEQFIGEDAGAGYTYQWQIQPGCTGSWSDISGATSYNYSPDAIIENTCYRRKVTKDGHTSYSYTGESSDISNLVLWYPFDNFSEPTQNRVPIADWNTQTGWSSFWVTQTKTIETSNLPFTGCYIVKSIINATGTGGPAYKDVAIPTTAGLVYTVSAYVKSQGRRIQIWCHDGSASELNMAYSPKNVADNTWSRVEVQFTSTTSAKCRVHFLFEDGCNGDIVYVTAPQVEQKPYSTPYVLTLRNDSIYDYSDNGKTGKLDTIKTPHWISDRGGAYEFINGRNSYSELKYTLGNLFSNSFTVAMWAYFNDNTADVLFGDKGRPSCLNVNFEKTATGALRLYWNNSPDIVTNTGLLTTGQWYYISYVRDKENNKVLFYVDGSLVYTYNGSISDKTATGLHLLGRDNNTDATTFNGKMDDFRIYSKALSADEIHKLSTANYLKVELPNPAIPTGECLGSISTDWFDCRNWGQGRIPNADIDATIKAATEITSSGAECKNLTIQPDVSLGMSANSSLDIYGNISNQGTFNPGEGTVILTGETNSSIGSTAISFYNLTINKTHESNNIVTLNKDISIVNKATFTSGYLVSTPSPDGLISFENGSVASSCANSFVVGPVKKTGNNTFTFPIGDIQNLNYVWAPLKIEAPSDANDAFTAQYFYKTASPEYPTWNNGVSMGDGLHHVSGKEYWMLDRNGGVSNPAITLYWYDAVKSDIACDNPANCTDYAEYALADLTVAHWNGSNWENKGGSATGTWPSGEITSTIAFTNYSPITIGSKTGKNPLPIQLIDFSALCDNDAVLLKWTTATETNNNYFTIEKSYDLSQWISVKTIQGAGNSSLIQTYNAYDNDIQKMNTYYRLKSTDYNGDSHFSKVILSECNGSDYFSINIFPNPAKNNLACIINTSESLNAEISIYNTLGEIVFQNGFNFDFFNNFVEINVSSLAKSVYFIKIASTTGDSLKFTKLIIE